MSPARIQASWHPANDGLAFPSARCGHICVVVDREEFGTELVVIHGGINANKTALDDLAVFNVSQQDWLQLPPATVGPAARAFHAACVIGTDVFIFAGHVFLPHQKKLHQFNDLWRLDAVTWKWHRMEIEHGEAPQPPPRDRAAMVAIDDHQLLIYGGVDVSGKRLDDIWVYNLQERFWREIVTAGAKPRPRSCASLFMLGNRVMEFGGDAQGPTNELWSLRGAQDALGTPTWTLLQLEGQVPSPRKGHTAVVTDRWGIFIVGGLSEQKSLLGMKKQIEYLMDVAVLQRRGEVLAWGVVSIAQATNSPIPREMHAVCALRDGRLLMFGGTDGNTTLGDAWWLELNEVGHQDHLDLMSFSDIDLESKLAAPSPVHTNPPSLGLATTVSSSSSPSTLPVGYWSVPNLTTAMPAFATSALSTLRGRLGLPSGTTLEAPSSIRNGALSDTSALDDDRLLDIGRRALRGTAVHEVGETPETTCENVPLDELVRAARKYLCECSADELRLGELPALMADYRRIAVIGWAALLEQSGPETLVRPDVAFLGRYVHLTAEDIRLKEIDGILEDYRRLALAVSKN